MVDRPPVRLLARLPEGNANGFDLEVDRLIDQAGPAEPEGYALVRYVSPKIDVNRETGVTTAVVRIVEIEPLVAGVMPTAYDHAGEALQAIRGDRTGTHRIPEDDAAGYARLVELRRQMEAYRVEAGASATTLGKAVRDTVPGAEAGWRDDPRIIAEYLQTVAEVDEDAIKQAQAVAVDESSKGPQGDDPGPVGLDDGKVPPVTFTGTTGVV